MLLGVKLLEGESIADLDCDNVVGVGDLAYVHQVINAQHSIHYSPMSALRQSFGSQVGDENYSSELDDGDCMIGMTDFVIALQSLQ